jgi:hypothetical protein
MEISNMIARQARDVISGGNWTSVNLRDTLSGITLEQARHQIPGFNSIATLVYHMNYYMKAVHVVMEGGALDAKDKLSFELPPLISEEDWEKLLDDVWKDAENFAGAIEKIPQEQLATDFVDSKYGSWYRNLHGIIEHTHYHLGQIVFLKKMISQSPAAIKK